MKTLKIVAIALTLTALNSGIVYANQGDSPDSNVQLAQLSGDTVRVSEKKSCCTPCPTEEKVAEPETKERREYPVREWSGRDR